VINALRGVADPETMVRRLMLPACALAVAAAVAASLVGGVSASRAQQSHRSSVLTLDLGVLQQLNQVRRAHHLVPFALDPSLGAAAREHSQDMLENGFFAHDSSDGEPFWKRIQAFYPQSPSGYWSVGENLYWTSGPATASGSVEAWMASPGHRANILDPAWRQIGIATASSPDAPGAFANLGVTVITTDFGVRR
jgi:uncharacterized protein YkwD